MGDVRKHLHCSLRHLGTAPYFLFIFCSSLYTTLFFLVFYYPHFDQLKLIYEVLNLLGKSTPVNMPGSTDSAKTTDPFQPFSADPVDPFQSKKGPGDPFSGKDPFGPPASSKASKDSTLGFADFSSVS